ncbi:hypothetical protein SAMN04487770_11786 [Butyrivibrio sp. ob235]|uniref:hypothetical protein n=1 Tax=Butyrivibrio sp. ob235 TaxID=1761780 RepID=UPI0008B056D4|nr:hypothetical protein [Butyrivibrio sp. ob235]SEL79289.1 hypothetical protein SAMN04487770_11786 [Butyrivibrio sp. ob235]
MWLIIALFSNIPLLLILCNSGDSYARSHLLSGLFAKTDDAVKNSKKDFADVAVAANDAYAFSSDLQIDLTMCKESLKHGKTKEDH